MTDTGWRSLREAYASLVVVAAAGICLSILILLTTICTKSLRSTAHILIGCCALFDILHEIGYFIQFPILFSVYYTHSFTCSCMQFIPVLGRSAAVICSLCIGIDRMLCMLDVVVYERMKSKHLHAYYVLSVLLFCIWAAFLMIANWTPKLQICTMLAPFHGDSRALLWNTISGIYILISLIYFITWQTVNRTGDAASQPFNNANTTLTIVMIVEVSTWFISSLLVELTGIYFSQEFDPLVHYVACVLVSGGIAAKPIVLFLLCEDYQRAFHALRSREKTSDESEWVVIRRSATDECILTLTMERLGMI